MPNTSAAKVLTARKSQFKALQHKMLSVKLETICANKATIYFENRTPLSSINII